MERGPSISPITRKPKDVEAEIDRQEKKARHEETLKAKAAKLGVIESAAGLELQKLIGARLLSRVETLVNEDPEASTYQKILKDMGAMENLAGKAVDELYRRTRVKRG